MNSKKTTLRTWCALALNIGGYRGGIACALLAVALISSIAFAQGTHYTLRVDIANGSPEGDGSAWDEDAFKFLQDALTRADLLMIEEDDTVDIWVASAYRYNQESPPQLVPYPYRPDQRATNGPAAPCRPYGDCQSGWSFHLRNNVRILGGFPPDPHDFHGPGVPAGINDRNPALYETILSADLEDDDLFETADIAPHTDLQFTFSNYGDNSLVIVRVDTNEDRSAVLDGFTIQGASNTGGGDYGGPAAAGLQIAGGSPTIRNCTFQRNYSFENGGQGFGAGVDVLTNAAQQGPMFHGCTFRHNGAEKGGPAIISNGDGNIEVIECTFVDNLVPEIEGGKAAGGAVWIKSTGTATFVNCKFIGNQLNNGGNHFGAGLDSSASMTRIWNCLFAYNRADRCADQGGVGALRIDGDAEIINCTFADNEGLPHPSAPSQPAHGGIYVISGEVDIRASNKMA